MQSVGPALPELEVGRNEAIPAPVRRLGYLPFGVLGLQLGKARLQDLPISDDITLVGRQSAELATVGATGEIGHRLFIGSLYQ